jgi:hypothetical protein
MMPQTTAPDSKIACAADLPEGPSKAVEGARQTGNHNHHATAHWICGPNHVTGGVSHGFVQAVSSLFLVRRDAIKRFLDQDSIAGESLHHGCRAVIGHHCYFVDSLQTIDCLTRRAMDFVAVRVQTAAPVNQEDDGQGQAILAEVSDLLPGSIFVNQKVFLF